MAGDPAVLAVGDGRWDELVRRARRLRESALGSVGTAAGRRLLGITGAPAAGKSTVAAAIVDALAPDAVLVGMDGFHLAEVELHRLGRHERKGAIDTFDGEGYVALLQRLRGARSTVYAPEFRREIEEPIAGAVPVPPDLPLVITEGNYLLVDRPPWRQVRTLLDEVWFLEVDEAVRLDRLTARHMAFGRPAAQARARALGTDQRNADLIATTRDRADLIVRVGAADG